ncbi:MAG TPA: lamin tail domain-containing protein, partial [Chitinophagaceae bacterium]
MKPKRLLTAIFLIPLFTFSQTRYSIVIDEIMADPAPQVGLPGNEWIELKNISTLPLNLGGWHLANASAQTGSFPDFTLQPDSFLLVCSSNAAPTMSAFGNTISVAKFPSLDNDGDLLILSDENGNVIDAVDYSNLWYQNELKKEGGWTLEMIDTKNPCGGSSNWKASIAPTGGTPGIRNSVDAIITDEKAPGLKYTFLIDSMTIVAVFDKAIDSLEGSTSNNYSLSGNLLILSATLLPPLFNTTQLKLGTPLAPNIVYVLTANNIVDCHNNAIGANNMARVGLPAEALQSDIVINEILFNPKPNDFDYVEFYNRSNKILDASRLFCANRNSNGDIASIEQIFPTPFYIFPGDYIVVTENSASLAMNYLIKNPEAVIEMTSLPSYPDDEGNVILLNGQGEIVDEVNYFKDWQFKLIDDPAGVALERIDPGGASQDESNWHSAAATAGYGTPGYQNSQFKQTQAINATIGIHPKIFSPDNDGHDDVTSVLYKVSEQGYIANVTIFNAEGRPVRYLARNEILGLAGQWKWDGLDEKGNKLTIGAYIIYTEIFNLRGKTQHFRNA